MTSEPTRVRCQSLTRAGAPCKNYALPVSDYCRVHQPSQQPAEAAPGGEEPGKQLLTEMDDLAERVQAATPDYQPPPFSPERLRALIDALLDRFPVDLRKGMLAQLRGTLSTDVLDLDVLKGVWYMLNYTVQYQAKLVRRRFTGEYDTDEWGLDWEFVDAVRPFFTFLYKAYWRVQTTGLENIPVEGRALLVANHSGQLPWDGTMVMAAVLSEHPAQRLVRTLYADWFAQIPFLSTWLVRMGQAPATVENGAHLLGQEELVAVFPEGQKGAGKPYRERYQLGRFGREGFRMALSTGSPIIPVSVVGAEETYIALTESATLARLIGVPHFPITPTFPWLGLLGLVPLPTRWFIDFGRPIEVDAYGPDAADNLVLGAQLTDQVRNTVQDMVHNRLAQRKSVFFG